MHIFNPFRITTQFCETRNLVQPNIASYTHLLVVVILGLIFLLENMEAFIRSVVTEFKFSTRGGSGLVHVN